MNLTDPALAAGSFGSYICKVKKIISIDKLSLDG